MLSNLLPHAIRPPYAGDAYGHRAAIVVGGLSRCESAGQVVLVRLFRDRGFDMLSSSDSPPVPGYADEMMMAIGVLRLAEFAWVLRLVRRCADTRGLRRGWSLADVRD